MFTYLIVFLLAAGIASWAHSQSVVRDGGLIRPRRFSGAALIVAAILAGVSALRYGVGTDYWAYDNNFESYVAEFSEGVSLLEEPGIRFLAWLADSVNTGSAGMFALAAFITVGFVVRTTWRWSVAFGFSIAVYILSGAWHGSFNGVRQHIAAAILLAGHRYIIERKFFRWSLVVLIATLFHVSALVGVLMYFIPQRRLSIWSQLFFFAVAAVLMFGSDELLRIMGAATGDMDLQGYDYVERSVNPLRIAFHLLPWALYWILPVRERIEHRGDCFYANMLLIIAAVALAGGASAYLARFWIYPVAFLPIALALITSLENRKHETLVRAMLLLVMAIFMYVEVSGSSSLRDFEWIFN